MFPPFEPDPGWFERYWYADRPEPKHRPFFRNLARYAVLAALLAGGALAVSNHYVQSDVSNGLQDWEQE